VRLNVVGVNNFKKNIHDLLLDLRPQHHILAVYPMQDSLEVVSLTRVLAIKELQEAIYEIC